MQMTSNLSSQWWAALLIDRRRDERNHYICEDYVTMLVSSGYRHA